MTSLKARINRVGKRLYTNRYQPDHCRLCGGAESPPAVYTLSDDTIPLELIFSNGKILPCHGGKIPDHCPRCGRKIQYVGIRPQEARLIQGLSAMSEFKPDGHDDTVKTEINHERTGK